MIAILAALAGAFTVFGFAPFRQPWLPPITVAILLELIRRQPTCTKAATTGFVFALGLFGAGVSWLYVSMADFGGMGPFAAATLTALACGYLAMFHALFGALAWLVRYWTPFGQLLSVPALWAGCEWLRGVSAGFPWLSLGYSQVPESPLSNIAPLLGIYGVGAVVVAVASALAAALGRRPGWLSSVAAAALASAIMSMIGEVAWTRPTGGPISVALLQGNVAQALKWRPDQRLEALQRYAAMVEGTKESLVVAPETALPLFLDELSPTYAARIQAHARRQEALVVMGVVERADEADSPRIYNVAVAMDGGGVSLYRKKHLVAFGEYVPLRPLLEGVAGRLAIPMSDMTPGQQDQRPWPFLDQRIAVNICFEDVFGAEIARSAAAGTLLLNMSNLAWFGRSLAAAQHLQIAQARSLETGRYSMRATNTGVTAIIDHRGQIVGELPQYTHAALTGSVRGFSGMTPYMRWTDIPVVTIALVVVAIALARARRRPAESLS